MNSSDRVFVLRGNQLSGLPSRTFREGIREANLEASLQELLADYPELIPGNQIAPGESDPPKFLLLDTEGSLANRFSVDLILVDQLGVPTIIETKLLENPDSRRDVIGQILEYAAIGVVEWREGQLRNRATDFWARKNRSLDEELAATFGDYFEDGDAFWEMVESNLQSNTIRLIVAGDEVRDDVRRILEFLNKEMENVEVYALELQCYGTGAADTVIVPKIIGQTQQAADRRRTKGGKRRWPPPELRQHFEEMADDHPLRAQRLADLLDWAIGADRYIESMAVNPHYSIGTSAGERLLTFGTEGYLHWYLEPTKYTPLGGVEARTEFYEGLKKIGLADQSLDPEVIKSSKNLLCRLDELSDTQYAQFKELLASLIL